MMLKDKVTRFLKDDNGAEILEYAIVAALMVAIGVVVFAVLGNGISALNTKTAEAIQSVSFTPSN